MGGLAIMGIPRDQASSMPFDLAFRILRSGEATNPTVAHFIEANSTEEKPVMYGFADFKRRLALGEFTHG